MVKKIVLFLLINLLTIPLKISKAPGLDEINQKEHIDYAKIVIADIAHQKFISFENERYRDTMRLYESSRDWTIVNQIGCIGYYQFKVPTLHLLGYTHITLAGFRKDPGIFPPELQDQAFAAYLNANWSLLSDYQCYVGTIINGVRITKSGLLAAAHLAGPDNVKKFLLVNGTYIITELGTIQIKHPKKERYVPTDINGTSVLTYLSMFEVFQI